MPASALEAERYASERWLRFKYLKEGGLGLPFFLCIQKNGCIAMIHPFSGAEDGTQTRDPQLGRLMLYQLSYFRNCVGKDGFEPPKA